MQQNVSRETLERLKLFTELLARWSSVLNLVSRSDQADIWARHVEDSLQLAAHVPAGTPSFVDIGSGGGFPAIPLAIVSGMFAHLIEADRRKAAFLEVVVSELALPAKVWNIRAETAVLPPQPVCTARAVAPLRQLITMCRILLLPTAMALFPKGRHYRAEMEEVARDPGVRVRSIPSKTDPEAALLVVTFSPGLSAH